MFDVYPWCHFLLNLFISVYFLCLMAALIAEIKNIEAFSLASAQAVRIHTLTGSVQHQTRHGAGVDTRHPCRANSIELSIIGLIFC